MCSDGAKNEIRAMQRQLELADTMAALAESVCGTAQKRCDRPARQTLVKDNLRRAVKAYREERQR